jgi:hypothetical protein
MIRSQARRLSSFTVHVDSVTLGTKKPGPAPNKETSMREIVRPVLATLSVACLAIALTALSNNAALAQAKQQMAPAPAQGTPPQGQAAQPPQLKQIALTDKQIDGVLAAQKEMNAITQKLPENAAPDPKVLAQLDGVAKKNGFAGNNEYYNVLDNISLVLGGIDPSSKKYVGPEAVIKAQIAEVQADKKMSAKDKKQALDDLNGALKQPQPAVENKGNIDLVVKNVDKLAAIMGEDQQ